MLPGYKYTHTHTWATGEGVISSSSNKADLRYLLYCSYWALAVLGLFQTAFQKERPPDDNERTIRTVDHHVTCGMWMDL